MRLLASSGSPSEVAAYARFMDFACRWSIEVVMTTGFSGSVPLLVSAVGALDATAVPAVVRGAAGAGAGTCVLLPAQLLLAVAAVAIVVLVVVSLAGATFVVQQDSARLLATLLASLVPTVDCEVLVHVVLCRGVGSLSVLFWPTGACSNSEHTTAGVQPDDVFLLRA